jgi:hypothetical protein
MRPHPALLERAFPELDLPAELAQLERERTATGAAQSAKTLTKYASLTPMVVRPLSSTTLWQRLL